jgi:NADH dehydrogenase
LVKNLVVLGAGYGGVTAALRLSRLFRCRPGYKIILVDRNDFHTLKTQLHEAAAWQTGVKIPLDRLLRRKNSEHLKGEVKGADISARTIDVDGTAIPYFRLVIAIGSEANYYNVPGLRENSIALQSTSDAELIYSRVQEIFALAAEERDPAARRGMLTIVIGGGGLSGIELAGELVERVRGLARENGIDVAEVQVTVVDGGARLVPELGEVQSELVESRLKAAGVRVLTGRWIKSRDQNSVHLSTGEVLESRTLIWTGGIKVSGLLGRIGLLTGEMGRVLVDGTLRVEGHPEIYAIGDNALAINPATGKAVPTAAQFALQQGRLVADNIRCEIEGRPLKPYRPRLMGEVVSLGRHLAAGWLALPFFGKIRFFGFIASLLKAAIKGKHILLLWRESTRW